MKRLISKRIDFEDDIVIVYDDKDKVVYEGLFDDCPYKDDIEESRYENGFYRLPQNYKATKANTNKKLIKQAWKEVDVLSFSPEYLADKILKLWNQIDGPLQNTFEAFTLRYDNDLKQKIADILNSQGYEVYPILLVDCPMYASKKNKKAVTAGYSFFDCFDEMRSAVKSKNIVDLKYFDMTYGAKNGFTVIFTLKDTLKNLLSDSGIIVELNPKIVDYSTELEQVLDHIGAYYGFELMKCNIHDDYIEFIFQPELLQK